MAPFIWVNLGSGNGFTWTNVDLSSKVFCSIHQKAISHEVLIILTHWCGVMHICISKVTIIGSDNGLSPGRHQLSEPMMGNCCFWTNFSEILIEIHTFSFKKMYLKMLCWKWRPFCLGLNVLIQNMCLETTLLVLLPHLPGELKG